MAGSKMINNYNTLVFDCDGVILNSNKVKTDAFYKAALAYGEEAAQALVEYHVENGGISRYKKFAYFLEKILPTFAANRTGPSLDELLSHYADAVLQGLLSCEVAEGLEELRLKTSDANWLIVSGGDQAELRKVFYERGLDKYFDGGIFGSPDNKIDILKRELENGNIKKTALFIGDSKYDYQAASKAGLGFLFINGWTEVHDHEKWCKNNNLKVFESVKLLLDF